MALLTVTLLLFLYTAFPVMGNIRLNEFSPDLSPQTVELINTSSESADISGWYLDDDGGSTYFTFPSGTSLPPLSCVLVASNLNLNKTTPDILRLFNNSAPPSSSEAYMVDFLPYTGSPGAGNSYTRLPDGYGDWSVKPSSFASYNSDKAPCVFSPSPTLTPTAAPATITPPPSPTVQKKAWDNIYISEIMPYPDTGQNEWVELYNANNETAHLEQWFIDDQEDGGSYPKQFSIVIAPNTYVTIELKSSLFNNQGDIVRLLDSDKLQKDSVEYGKTEKGESWSRTAWDSDTCCISTVTRNGSNTVCPQSDPVPSHTPFPSSTPPQRIYAQQLSSNPHAPYVESSYQTNGRGGEILGAAIVQPLQPATPHNSSTRRYLSLLSLSYSVLTMISVLVKMSHAFY